MGGYIDSGHKGILEIYSIASNAADTLVFTCDMMTETGMDFDADRLLSFTPANEQDDAALTTFLEAALPAGAPTIATTKRTYENGATVGGGSAGGTKYIAIHYGGLVTGGTSNDKRKVTCGYISVDPTSGSHKSKPGEPTNPKLVLKGESNTAAALTIAAAKFNTTCVTTPGSPVTIPQYAGNKISFMTKQA